MILLSLIAQIAWLSTILNCAKLHSESKYFGKIPFMKLSILLELLTFSPSTTGGYGRGAISSVASCSAIYLLVVAARDKSDLIAKICIVPLSDEHARNLETGSNEMQYTSA